LAPTSEAPAPQGETGEMMVRQTPHSGALAFEFVSQGPAEGALRVPWRADLALDAASGVIAGGVVTSLIDHTCGLAVGAALRTRTGAGAETANRMGSMATLDLRIDYLRAARPRSGVIAHAHCYKLTHSVAFVRASAYEDDPADPIATAQAAFALASAPAS